MATAYRRVVLKLSGASLQGSQGYGIDSEAVHYLAQEVKDAAATGVELAVVVGGGNIWRGADAAVRGMERAAADYAGMLATLINSLAFQEPLEQMGVDTGRKARSACRPWRTFSAAGDSPPGEGAGRHLCSRDGNPS